MSPASQPMSTKTLLHVCNSVSQTFHGCRKSSNYFSAIFSVLPLPYFFNAQQFTVCSVPPTMRHFILAICNIVSPIKSVKVLYIFVDHIQKSDCLAIKRKYLRVYLGHSYNNNNSNGCGDILPADSVRLKNSQRPSTSLQDMRWLWEIYFFVDLSTRLSFLEFPKLIVEFYF